MSAVAIRAVWGEAMRPYIADLARLRIAVFREYPYLYEGDEDYERRYLARYVQDHATLVIAEAGGRVVGAATAEPLASAHAELAAPFRTAGIDVARIYYFGESVLERPWRGRGLGHRFFDEREARARALGFARAAFCAVERAPDDPRRPPDHRDNDAFWAKRGYAKRPDLSATFSWREAGETKETPKRMVFWLRDLAR